MSDALHEVASALGVQVSGRDASGDEQRRRADILVGLAETNPHVRSSLRSFLRRKGFESITGIRNGDELAGFLGGTVGDLLVLDVTMDDMAVLETVRRARLGDGARNPYVVIVGTATKNDPVAIKRAIDAGVDDLLIKPLAPATLMERITALVTRRRPFIVTSDYVGPDRRRDPSRVSTIPTFEPPNTLAAKERGEEITSRDLQARIGAATKSMREERLRRYAFQIAFLIRLVVSGHGAGTATLESERPRLDRALRICHEAQDLLPHTDLDHLTPVWRTMALAVEGLVEEDPDWALGRVSSHSIELTLFLYPDRSPAQINSEVMKAVESYTARRHRLAEEDRRKAQQAAQSSTAS